MNKRTVTVVMPGEKTNYKKALKGRALKNLFFERDDYRARWHKLVGRVKIQTAQLDALELEIKRLNSKIANDGLALLLAKQKAEALESYVVLKRPDVLKLHSAVNKQKASTLAGVSRPINVTINTKKRMPRVAL